MDTKQGQWHPWVPSHGGSPWTAVVAVSATRTLPGRAGVIWDNWRGFS
ncbi:hypothetical protein [Arthrobacter sp. M4]|nr:hypothetical protein [Arthrobacter sp. M4]MCA4132367.1 hypothetical protein [Arthrobacter sp. M4]